MPWWYKVTEVTILICSLMGAAFMLRFRSKRHHQPKKWLKPTQRQRKPHPTDRSTVGAPEYHQEQTSSFSHAALRQPQSQIRLLKILHDQLTDPFDSPLEQKPMERKDAGISCSLTTWNSNDLPPYIAVSYTWGEPLPQRKIRVDGRALYVRHNCYYALWQASVQFPGAPLWIDSICINQQDHEEKSHQVRLMGKIYAGATKVLSCIGPHAQGSDRLFSALQVVKDGGLWPDSSAYTEAMAHLASRPYWYRLWIVQECALATCLYILCGDAITKASTLDRVRREVHQLDKDPMWTVLGLRDEQQTTLTLQDALVKFRAWRCSDPRDRIYGLAALVKWRSKKRITIDYNISSADLCRKAMMYCTDVEGLDALLRALDRRGMSALEDAGISLCKDIRDFRTVCRLLDMKMTKDLRTIRAALAFCQKAEDTEELSTILRFNLPIEERMKLARERLEFCSGGADIRILVRALDVADAVDLEFVRAAMLRIEHDWDHSAKAFLLSSTWVSEHNRVLLCMEHLRSAGRGRRSLRDSIGFVLAAGMTAEHPQLLEWTQASFSASPQSPSPHSATFVFPHHGHLCPIEKLDNKLTVDIPVYGPPYLFGCHRLTIELGDRRLDSTSGADVSPLRHGKYGIGHIDSAARAYDLLCPIIQINQHWIWLVLRKIENAEDQSRPYSIVGQALLDVTSLQKHHLFISWDWLTDHKASQMMVQLTMKQFLLFITSRTPLNQPRYLCGENMQSFVMLVKPWARDVWFSEHQAVYRSKDDDR